VGAERGAVKAPENKSGGRISLQMNWQERILVDPEILVGKPVIRGTRLAVEWIIDLLAQGWTNTQILDQYPGLKPEDIQACLAYASHILHSERIYPLPA
jgi:uncharacterized protein (DUF433 family)